MLWEREGARTNQLATTLRESSRSPYCNEARRRCPASRGWSLSVSRKGDIAAHLTTSHFPDQNLTDCSARQSASEKLCLPTLGIEFELRREYWS